MRKSMPLLAVLLCVVVGRYTAAKTIPGIPAWPLSIQCTPINAFAAPLTAAPATQYTLTASLNSPCRSTCKVNISYDPPNVLASAPTTANVQTDGNGKVTAQFTITTLPSYSQTTYLIISVSNDASAPVSQTVIINPSRPIVGPVLTNMVLTPVTIRPGLTSSATLTLDKPAPPGGYIVNLKYSDVSLLVGYPNSVTIPAGATQASFILKAASSITNTKYEVVKAFPALGPPMAKTLTISPRKIFVSQAFAHAGDIVEVTIILDDDTGQSYGLPVSYSTTDPLLFPPLCVPMGPTDKWMTFYVQVDPFLTDPQDIDISVFPPFGPSDTVTLHALPPIFDP